MIAVVGGVAVGGVLVATGAGAAVAASATVAILVLSAAAIYFRGYLVPGTPELTKRYFPEWVLAKFDKLPEESGVSAGAEDEGRTEEEEINPEEALLAAGALQPCEHEDDLCLAPEFRKEWADRIRAVEDSGVETDDVITALSIDEMAEDASLSEFGDAVVLERDGREVGKWESEAALVADVAAADVLSQRYGEWDQLGGVGRSKLLRGLRIFLDSCPVCSGTVSLGQDTVESCCRSYEVVAVSCSDCDSRLFEERWDGAAA